MSRQDMGIDDDDTSGLKYTADTSTDDFTAAGRAFMSEKPWYKRQRTFVMAVIAIVVIALIGVGIGYAVHNHDNDNNPPPPPVTPNNLVNAMDIDNVFLHLQQLDNIARYPWNKGSRAIQLGYNDSANYVMKVLAEQTDFIVRPQYFVVPVSMEPFPPTLQILTPDSSINSMVNLQWTVDYVTLMYSGRSGNNMDPTVPPDVVNAAVVPVLGGCSSNEYFNFPVGAIALIDKRNTTLSPGCSYLFKLEFAFAAGASGALVYDSFGASGTATAIPIPSPTGGRLGPGTMASEHAVFGLSPALGAQFLKLTQAGYAVNVSFSSSRHTVNYTTLNVIAETRTGRDDTVIVVGTHLDSVEAGPGINDNGSGSSMNLELAVEFAKIYGPRGTAVNVNKVRFCWWGAEEIGLMGSTYYVKSLKEQTANVSCNLNFDMLASPNFIRGVYDGANATGFPRVQKSSAVLQNMFYQYFTNNQINFKAVPFTGRSDYWGFIDSGIPAGGLDTGAEVVKPAAERGIFGGIANVAYDPCYHQSCDSLLNANLDVLQDLARAAASVVSELAEKPDLPGFLGPRIPASTSLSQQQTPPTSLMTSSWYPAGVSVPEQFDLPMTF